VLINDLLKIAVDRNASDLHLKVGGHPVIRVDGTLIPLAELRPLMQEETVAMAFSIMSARQKEKFKNNFEIDIAYSVPNLGRFRCNIFQQRGTVGLVLRVIPQTIRTIRELLLPPVIEKICQEQRGLVLCTGTTGSGKSTTLAAMIDLINLQRNEHIMTIEDPIEFLHRDKKSIINQREVDVDTKGFSVALRSALRQDPDVILVGEMRDYETIETALVAAETGHLVLSTLHTVNAGQAIDRIIGMFDQEEEKQIRQRLSETVRWIVGQRLVPKIGGGRWAVHDILANTIRSNELILQGEADGKTFYEIQEVGEPFGMMTFDQSLLHSYEHGLITEDTAVNFSTRRAVVQRGVDTIKQKRGEKTTEIEGLRLDPDYNRRLGMKR